MRTSSSSLSSSDSAARSSALPGITAAAPALEPEDASDNPAAATYPVGVNPTALAAACTEANSASS